MSNFRERFGNKPHVVLPVIHVLSEAQVKENVVIAKENGADGIFLINMRGMDPTDLLEMQSAAHELAPSFWVGLNHLGYSAVEAVNFANRETGGIWTDDAQITEGERIQGVAESVNLIRRRTGLEDATLYFGGIAFKYRRQPRDLASVAKIATQYMDVITTSGSGTGIEPDVEKMKLIRGAVGNFPIAIASGISPENVEDYKPTTDCFIVSTSLLVRGQSEMFDPERVRALVDAVRG